MRNSDRLAILKHLNSALESDAGIALDFLSPDDAKEYRQKVLQVRRESTLYTQVSTMIQGNELWLINRGEAPTRNEELANAEDL